MNNHFLIIILGVACLNDPIFATLDSNFIRGEAICAQAQEELIKKHTAESVVLFQQALSPFKDILLDKRSISSFDEFAVRIKSAEKIVYINQKLYELTQDQQYEQAAKKYATYVIRYYEDGFSALKSKYDFKGAISLATALLQIYGNNGKYISLFHDTYDLELDQDSTSKNIRKHKTIFYTKEMENIKNAQKAEAIALLEEALGKLTRSMDASDEIRSKAEDDAIKLLEDAYKIYSQAYQVVYKLADLYITRNLAEARRYLDEARKLVSTHAQEDDIKKLEILINKKEIEQRPIAKKSMMNRIFGTSRSRTDSGSSFQGSLDGSQTSLLGNNNK